MIEENGKIHQQPPCAHERVTAGFQIQRVGQRGESLIDLTVACADCGEPFAFTIGSPSPKRLRLAIVPASLNGSVNPIKRIVVPSLVGADN